MNFIDLQKQRALIKEQINQRIQTVLEHGQFIMGPEVKELEDTLCERTGAKHCIGVSNGTDALLISLLALGIGAGDEVITTPFTFFGTGEMISLIGAKPVFVDIEADTYNIDANLIEAAITEKTKAIMPVSLYGQPSDMTAINEIAARHNLPVIEDAAQSFGATHHGKASCNLSTIATTSFFPAKPLGAYGDAGACFTNDDEIATLMRQIRVHGQDRRYHHSIIGVNGRLDTLQAAIVLAKLEIFSDEIVKRNDTAEKYTAQLKDHFVTPVVKPENTSAFAQYTIQVDNREQLQAELKARGIPTAVHYPVPLNLQPVYAHLGLGRGSFPVAESAAERVLSLPMDAYRTDGEIAEVSAAVIDCYKACST